MSALVNTPSSGHSEVLDTLHFEHGPVALHRIGTLVSRRWSGSDHSGADSDWEADVVTVLGALQSADYVVGADSAGDVVDLTDSPAASTLVSLTSTGRVYARHPRPRPRAARG